jgi:hypothetical protein
MMSFSLNDEVSLNDEEFDKGVECDPSWALAQGRVTVLRMSDSQFNYCVKKEPGTALFTIHAFNRMSDIQFDNAIKSISNLLLLDRFKARMNPYQRAWTMTNKDPFPWRRS